jgi:hypothetical protein
VGQHVRAEREVQAMTVRYRPNLALAKRIASDLGRDDVLEVYGAIQRRALGLLFINARFDELSRDQYEDLCSAIKSELGRRPAHSYFPSARTADARGECAIPGDQLGSVVA